jgi:hypothetical protein
MRYSLLLFVVLAACTASGSARYSAEVTTPPLVYVSDDVQVIEDYNEPVFFSANMYWRYDNGVWYQSRYHTRGWVRVSSPPAQIVRIERPQAYVHYHASAQVHSDGPTRHEMKQEDKAARQEEKREIKEEKREEKREMKEEQREVKQEAKEAKQEAKDTKHEAKEARKEEKEERKDEKKNDKDDHKKGKK